MGQVRDNAEVDPKVLCCDNGNCPRDRVQWLALLKKIMNVVQCVSLKTLVFFGRTVLR
jgi:hypothetical protein